MEIPDNLKYTKTHEWVNVEGNGVVSIGITYHAQEELTDIVYVDDFPDVGDAVKKEDTIAVIESVKAVADVYSPVDGNVHEINEKLEEKPEALNESPYDAWIIKIKISNPEDIDNLLSPDQYAEEI